MKKAFKIISTIVSMAIFAVVVVVVGLMLSARFGYSNYRIFYITSGSMEPSIPVASVVLAESLETYQVGDIITFSQPGRGNLVTHRIVDITNQGKVQSFTTKGDANDVADNQIIPSMNVHGKVLYYLPYIGRLVAFVQTPLGFGLMVIVPGVILVVYEGYVNIRHILDKRRVGSVVSQSERQTA